MNFKTGGTYDICKNIPSWFRQILVHITYLSRIVFSRWFMHCDHRRLLLRYFLGLESQALHYITNLTNYKITPHCCGCLVFFCDLYLRFIPPINIWKIYIDFSVFSKQILQLCFWGQMNSKVEYWDFVHKMFNLHPVLT